MSRGATVLLAVAALGAAAFGLAAAWFAARLFAGFPGGGSLALHNVWLPAAPHVVLSLVVAGLALARRVPAWLAVLVPLYLYWGVTGLGTGGGGEVEVAGSLPWAARGTAIANLAVAALLVGAALGRSRGGER